MPGYALSLLCVHFPLPIPLLLELHIDTLGTFLFWLVDFLTFSHILFICKEDANLIDQLSLALQFYLHADMHLSIFSSLDNIWLLKSHCIWLLGFKSEFLVLLCLMTCLLFEGKEHHQTFYVALCFTNVKVLEIVYCWIVYLRCKWNLRNCAFLREKERSYINVF